MLTCLLPKDISALSRTEEKTAVLCSQLKNMERELWKNVRHKKLASKITNMLLKLTNA